MTSIETVSIVIAAVSVVIGVISMIRSNRRAEEQRQMQLFTQLYSYVVEKDFSQDWVEWRDILEWKNFDDWLQRYFSANKDNLDDVAKHDRLRRLVAYLSVALNRGLFDLDLVDDLIGLTIVQWWEKMKPIYLEGRKYYPRFGDDVEKAYNLLVKRGFHEYATKQYTSPSA